MMLARSRARYIEETASADAFSTLDVDRAQKITVRSGANRITWVTKALCRIDIRNEVACDGTGDRLQFVPIEKRG